MTSPTATKAPNQQGLNALLILSLAAGAAYWGWSSLSPERQAGVTATALATWAVREDPAALLRMHGYTLLSVVAALIGLRVAWMLFGRTLKRIGVLRPSATTVRRSAAPRSSRALSKERGDTTGHDTTTPRGPGVLRRMEGSGAIEQAGTEPPPRRWLVPDLVPYGPLPRWRFGWCWPPAWREVRGYVTAMVGMAGTKKSYLLTDFGLASVTGGAWAGRPVQRLTRVLYVDCELDPETFWRRAFELARGRGLKKPPKGLRYVNLHGVSLASEEGWQRVWDARRRCNAEAILVDSITIGAFTVTTNDAGAMNRLFGSFEAWGVPVFAIDHLGKDPGRGAVGSFMKYAKIRSELTLRAGRGVIEVSHSKTNFGPQLEPFRILPSFVGGTPGEGPLTVSFPPASTTNEVPSATPSAAPVRRVVQSTGGMQVPVATMEQAAPGVVPALAYPEPHRPLSLPVLTPPVAPVPADTASPLLAFLSAFPDDRLPVKSCDIYAARDQHGVPERKCKVDLLALTTAGLLERSGSRSQGYSYRLADRVEPAQADAGVGAAG